MKYCKKCGSQLEDNQAFCPNCGEPNGAPKKSNGMQQAAGVFMIAGGVLRGLAILPLIWVIPMIKKYYDTINAGYDVSDGFKALTLVFTSFLGGLLMFLSDGID